MGLACIPSGSHMDGGPLPGPTRIFPVSRLLSLNPDGTHLGANSAFEAPLSLRTDVATEEWP